jgi:hypothetical protein
VNSPPLAEREFLLLTRCLEDRERSALRICHHSHAANIFNLHKRHVEFRTKAFGLCGYHMAIGDQQINLPVRWRPGIAKRWRQNSPNELIVIEEMIVVVGGIFIFLPNSLFEKLLIKSAGAILIGYAQVSHTECTVSPAAWRKRLLSGPARLPSARRHTHRTVPQSLSRQVPAFSTAT